MKAPSLQVVTPLFEEPVVCHFLENAAMGGAENLVVHLANIHARQGKNSHVIIMETPGPLSPRFESQVHLHYLNYRRASIKNPFRFISSLIKGYNLISKTIKAEGIQIFQSHLSGTNLWGLLFHVTGKCQTVITVHSNNVLSGKFGTRFGKWATYQAYRFMPRACGAMIAVSSKVKDSLVEQLKLSPKAAKKIIFIDNGIPMPGHFTPEAQKSLRQSFGVSENATWIVAAGRLAEPKNFSCLIRCAAWLKRNNIDFKILIAGEGPLRGELEQLCTDLGVKDLIKMPGNLDNLQEILLSSNIFAIPSLWEGLPLVLIEAMASQLPVVGSRTRGIEDIIEHGKNGFLSEVNDHESLAKDIVKLIKDNELAASMGKYGRKISQDNYDIEETYSKYLQTYNQLIR